MKTKKEPLFPSATQTTSENRNLIHLQLNTGNGVILGE